MSTNLLCLKGGGGRVHCSEAFTESSMKVFGSCTSPTRRPSESPGRVPRGVDINSPGVVVSNGPVWGASRGYVGVDENVKVSQVKSTSQLCSTVIWPPS